MLDISPLLHAVSAVLFQMITGCLVGEWAAIGAIGCMWFIAHDHTKSEYRWIAQLGVGKRDNMPWSGGFDWRAWNVASMLDWFVPFIAVKMRYG